MQHATMWQKLDPMVASFLLSQLMVVASVIIGSIAYFVGKCILKLVTRYAEVDQANDSNKMTALIEQLITDDRILWKFGECAYQGDTVPSIVIGLWFVGYMTKTKHSTFDNVRVSLVFEVYTLFFSTPFLKFKPAKKLTKGPDTIQVLEATSNELDAHLDTFVQFTLPIGMSLSGPMERDCMIVVSKIVEMFKSLDSAIGHPNRVVVLHGPTGCGKSTCARLVAQALNGTLFAKYNPHCVRSLIGLCNYHATPDCPLVIACDEVDVPLGLIAVDQVPEDASHEKQTLDATNKKTWNELMDSFRLRSNCVLVMTTNVSTKDKLLEIVSVKDTECSMLRRPRVDGHFEWSADPDKEVKFVEPFELPRHSLRSPAALEPDTQAVVDQTQAPEAHSVVDMLMS